MAGQISPKFPKAQSRTYAELDVAHLSPEQPIWSADLGNGPHPVYCYYPGDLVLCPVSPEQHRAATTIGYDEESFGIVCEDCNTVYTARPLPLDHIEKKRSVPGMPDIAETICPDTFYCSTDITVSMPPAYELACIEEHYPIWAVDFTEGPFPIDSYETGDEVLCPKHLTQHPPARAIGPRCAAAGVVCHECQTVYALTCILPMHLRGEVPCVCNHRDDLKTHHDEDEIHRILKNLNAPA